MRKYSIGYCNAEDLMCRPKYHQYAIMCRHPETNESFWFHIFKFDFEEVFMENKIRNKNFNCEGSKRSGKNGATNNLKAVQRSVKKKVKRIMKKMEEKNV